jgi:hypothetical protein
VAALYEIKLNDEECVQKSMYFTRDYTRLHKFDFGNSLFIFYRYILLFLYFKIFLLYFLPTYDVTMSRKVRSNKMDPISKCFAIT